MPKISDQIAKLTRVGVALSSEHDLEKLLEMIVREARGLSNADAGSLYIKEGEHLKFVVSQNDTLERRIRDAGKVMDKFKPFPVKISNESISGYVANNAETVKIQDVHKIPKTKTYKFNKSFDEKNNYRSQSMLVVPMVNPSDDVIGVLQLINAQKISGDNQIEKQVIPFNETHAQIIKSLASQAAVAITNAQLTQKLKGAYLDTIYRLSIAAEYKDQDTASHIKRMSLYSKVMAKNYGMSDKEVELVLYASPMHDVGKLGVPDAILLKKGPLTPEERIIMQHHTTYGAKIMEGSDSETIEFSRVIALNHHEKWDGTGYPNKLKGEDIPISGRIVAIADVFDALTSRRPYKEPWPIEKACEQIAMDAGTFFDPDMAALFKRSIDEIKTIYEGHKEH